MQNAVPPTAKITKQAVEDMEQYVLEFMKFLTSEGVPSPLSSRTPSIPLPTPTQQNPVHKN